MEYDKIIQTVIDNNNLNFDRIMSTNDKYMSRMMDLIEKSLTMQNNVVTSVNEVKNKVTFDAITLLDILQQHKQAFDDLFKKLSDINNIMIKTSNSELLIEIKQIQEYKNKMELDFKDFVIKVDSILSTVKKINDVEEQLDKIELVEKDSNEKITFSSTIYKVITVIVSLLVLAVGGIQLINKMNDNERNNKIDTLIKKIEQKK